MNNKFLTAAAAEAGCPISVHLLPVVGLMSFEVPTIMEILKKEKDSLDDALSNGGGCDSGGTAARSAWLAGIIQRLESSIS